MDEAGRAKRAGLRGPFDGLTKPKGDDGTIDSWCILVTRRGEGDACDA